MQIRCLLSLSIAFGLTLASVGQSGPAQAQPATLSLTSGILSFKGEITPAVVAPLTHASWEKVRLVRFESAGGDVKSSIAIGRLLAAKYIPVQIHDDCSSACFNVLIAGKNITIKPGTIVLLHQSISGQAAIIGFRYPHIAAANRTDALEESAWLEKNGVNPDLLLLSQAMMAPGCASAPTDDIAATPLLKIGYRFQVWAPRDETLRHFGVRLGEWRQTPSLVLSEMAQRHPQADIRRMQVANEPVWTPNTRSSIERAFRVLPPCP